MRLSEAGLNGFHLTYIPNAGIKMVATVYDSMTTFLQWEFIVEDGSISHKSFLYFWWGWGGWRFSRFILVDKINTQLKNIFILLIVNDSFCFGNWGNNWVLVNFFIKWCQNNGLVMGSYILEKYRGQTDHNVTDKKAGICWYSVDI